MTTSLRIVRRFASTSKPPSPLVGGLLQRPSNKEALRLYRDVLRAARSFNFPHPEGELWSTVLTRSARMEFEAARHVSDPETVMRLLVVGTDALMRIQHQFAVAEDRLVKAVRDGPPAPGAQQPQGPRVVDESPYALDQRAPMPPPLFSVGQEGGITQGRARGPGGPGAESVMPQDAPHRGLSPEVRAAIVEAAKDPKETAKKPR